MGNIRSALQAVSLGALDGGMAQSVEQLAARAARLRGVTAERLEEPVSLGVAAFGQANDLLGWGQFALAHSGATRQFLAKPSAVSATVVQEPTSPGKKAMPLMTSSNLPVEFADDPIASHSAQFGLARPMDTPATQDTPSPIGVRPWNLRAATTMPSSGSVQAWRYDHERQIAVTQDGQPITEIIDATAHSVTNLDGDEGPNEDWKYDFHPDDPGNPA
jgi:putative ATP-grasp target RiPP